jgi:osmoprotectant transport system ATP-binding protein
VGTPAQMLSHPASAAVRAFLGGAELALRRLALQTVGARTRPGSAVAGPALPSDMSLRAALGVFLERATDRLPVVDERGRPLGTLSLQDLLDTRAR